MIKSFLKKRIGLIAFCTINSILLLIITFTWINHSYFLTDDEEYLIKGSVMAKDIIAKAGEKPDTTRFAFINIAWEKTLVNEYDQNGQLKGKRPITDRKRLAKFFEYLNKDPQHQFIILDVWFVDSSDYKSDSLLQDQFKKTKNFLIPFHKDPNDDNKIEGAIFKAPTALSDYEKDDFDNNFVKFRLVQGDGFKTTPLVFYENLHKEKFESDGFWHYLGDKLALNSFILSMRIWDYDLRERQIAPGKIKSLYDYYQMSYFLDFKADNSDSLPPSVTDPINDNIRSFLVSAATKDKILVIGDFEDADKHQTVYGPQPGPLILLNVFLALEAGDNLINLGFVLFLFIGYFLISFKCFTRIDILDRFLIGRLLPQTNFRAYIMNFMSYIIYFIILSLISYFLFNIHLTILLLALYMELVERVLGMFEKKKTKEISNNATLPTPIA